jgi:hypothetical protein
MVDSNDTPAPRTQSVGRIASLVLLGAAVILVLAFFVGYLGLNSYVRGDSFRKLVGQKTSAWLRGDGEYMPFHWSGASVYSDGFEAKGRAGSWFTHLRADQIRAEFHLRGILRRAWQVNELEIQRLQVTLGKPAGQPVAESAPTATRSPSRWSPNRFELREARIVDANLDWGSGTVKRVKLTIRPEARSWNLSARGGELRQTGWPVASIESAKLRYQERRLFITEGRLKPADGGTLDVSGEVGIEKNSAFTISVAHNGLPAASVLPSDWRARLLGNLRGETELSGAPSALQANGTIQLDNGRLEALPILDRIAEFTKTEQFKRFPLQTASAEYDWKDSKLTVTRLVIESEGLIRIEGGFVVERGRLEGEFQVGVTASSLRWLPGSRAKVFTVERGGYLWTTMRLTGPLDRLQEDLSPRLIAAAQGQLIEDAKSTVEQGARQLLDLLDPLVR